jgi:hypothetical protein
MLNPILESGQGRQKLHTFKRWIETKGSTVEAFPEKLKFMTSSKMSRLPLALPKLWGAVLFCFEDR